MEKLPLEITSDILVGLPIVSQLRCREVCRTWRTLLPKPEIGLLYEVSSGLRRGRATEIAAKFYFSEQNIDSHVLEQLPCFGTLTFDREPPSNLRGDIYKSFVVGSCNGLVCYASLAHGKKLVWEYGFATGRHWRMVRICAIQVYICNPVTGEDIQLPAINCYSRNENGYSRPAVGFGYSRSNSEYKVVIRGGNLSVHVYTLHHGAEWRTKQCKCEKLHLPSRGVFAGGALHWIDEGRRKTNIITFDLENESFKLLVPSIPCAGHDPNHVGLMVLGGNLCVLEVVPSKHVTIWESVTHAHEQPGYISPWVKMFSMAWVDCGWVEPFEQTKSWDPCLLWYNAALSCYDPVTRTFRKLDETLRKFMDDSTSWVYTTKRATPHVNSLISLRRIMQKRVEQKNKVSKKKQKRVEQKSKASKKKKRKACGETE